MSKLECIRDELREICPAITDRALDLLYCYLCTKLCEEAHKIYGED